MSAFYLKWVTKFTPSSLNSLPVSTNSFLLNCWTLPTESNSLPSAFKGFLSWSEKRFRCFYRISQCLKLCLTGALYWRRGKKKHVGRGSRVMTRAALSEDREKEIIVHCMVCALYFAMSDWFDPGLSRLTVVQPLKWSLANLSQSVPLVLL